MSVETIEQVRTRNFLWLFERFKEEVRNDWPGEPDRGMVRRFAQRLGISPIYTSQIKNGKVIGTALADKIEKALGLQDGWLDTDHTKSIPAEDEDLAAAMDAFRGMYEHSPEATRAALVKVMGAIVTGKPIESIVDKKDEKVTEAKNAR
jgi:transcriptional regulator with XRE-family HTH domain